jgi:hypothetical protein
MHYDPKYEPDLYIVLLIVIFWIVVAIKFRLYYLSM